MTEPWALTTPTDFSVGHVSAVLTDRVLDDARVVVRGGRIAEVGPHPRGGASSSCCDAHGGGLHLLPGLIDVHSDTLGKECHPRPGATLPPGQALASTAARLRGAGVTTAFHGLAFQTRTAVGVPIDSPNAEDLGPALEATRRLTNALVDHRVLHRLDVRDPVGRERLEARLAEVASVRPGEPPVVSHEDHTPGQGQYADPEVMQRWLQRAEGMSAEQSAAHVAWWQDSRDEHLELRDDTLAWLGGLARERKVRLFGHDPATADDVDALVDRGGAVAEFPTTRQAARRARERGLLVVAGAANVVLGGSHSGNVSAADLAALGLVDVLASDYLPTALLPAASALAASGALTLTSAVALITSGPAEAVGLADRGCLRQGRRADLVLADLSGSHPVVRWVARAAEPAPPHVGAVRTTTPHPTA